MPKAIPDGLTKDHVLLALKDLDEGIEHDFGEATGYQLINDDKGYAPKAVVGIAVRHLTGTILGHGEFSGGEQKGQPNPPAPFYVMHIAGSWFGTRNEES